MNEKPPRRSDAVRNALQHTKPVPDESFAQALEDRLLARLETHHQKDEEPNMIRILHQKRKHEQGRMNPLPLTLVAALGAVILGGMMLLGGGFSRPPQFAGVIGDHQQPKPTATFTPTIDPFTLTATVIPAMATVEMPVMTATPIPLQATVEMPDMSATPIPTQVGTSINLDEYVPVVIAARDFVVGETITAEMITVAYWERDFAFLISADQSGTWFFGDPERVIGAVVSMPVTQFQPITSAVSTAVTPDAGQLTAFYLPPERFIGDYSILKTDSAAQLVLLLDGNSPFVASDLPASLRADESGRVLSFDVIVQIGSYVINNPDGTTSSGESARILLTIAEADFLQRLLDEGIAFHYTLLPAS